jgi:hypothetical protein
MRVTINMKLTRYLCWASVFTSLLFLSNAASLADSKPLFTFEGPTGIMAASDSSKLFLDAAMAYGTHREGIGLECSYIGYKPNTVMGRMLGKDLNEELGLLSRVGVYYHERDFGFPGESLSGKAELILLYSLGPRNDFFSRRMAISGLGRHNLSFGLNGYVSSDSTSQVTGQIDYGYFKNDFGFTVNYENDTIFLLQDQYRTASVKLSALFQKGNDLYGLSLGFNLWAGQRIIDLVQIWNGGNIQLPEEKRRGNTVALYNGKDYSTDVIYLSLIYNNMSFSVGYDSERIKQLIQNNVHFILDDGNLPLLDRPDRLFLEFKIGLLDELY